MPLSDAKIRNAKPQSKPYKLADSEGMYLLVHPNGGKYWRLKYRFAGRERILALGVYPEVDLSLARERRLAARKALAGSYGATDPASEVVGLAVPISVDNVLPIQSGCYVAGMSAGPAGFERS